MSDSETPLGHAADCEWHGQNDGECTCGFWKRREAKWTANEITRCLTNRQIDMACTVMFSHRHIIREALEAFVRSPRDLAERVMQAHEWGYRDPVVGGFVEHSLPFELAEAVLAQGMSARESRDGNRLGPKAASPVDEVDAPR